jgi:hypothetical protein
MATKDLGAQNFFSTTLSAAIDASDTTIYLDSVPTPTEGYLVISSASASKREVIYYTSKGANFVTCPATGGRGVGNTTAQSHDQGETVEMNMVAQYFEALQDGSGLKAERKVAGKTVIGSNDVRATRFVVLDNAVEALSTNPANTNWTELDLSAHVSANAYAVALVGQCTSTTTAGRTLSVIKNGATETANNGNRLARNPSTSVTGNGSLPCVGLDANKKVKWQVSNADVVGIEIHVPGYWEYVD